ncbi:MAG: undecaprenyl-diphosphate phosphatase [ANME-2 cluster archaeon]|nr:undecaprenyl-diphosphate phosphatase [ANME-2 cluster archaeon]
MDIIQAIVLGIIQGIFEWLPISSEGQSMLILLNAFHMNVEEALSFAIFMHLGTSFAVMIKFWKEFRSILSGKDHKLTSIIVISTVCTGLTGLPLYFILKNTFTGGITATLLIGILLVLTGIILGLNKGKGHKTMDSVTRFDMIILGLVQGFAILPGISRSGVTLTTLLLRNVEQKTALVISFLISVPVVLGAVALDAGMIFTIDPLQGLALFLSSLLIGYLMMDFLMRFAERVDFSLFCISLGGLTIILAGGYYIL